jgi:MFS family permease
MFEALRVRDFRLLWLARLISSLGSWLLVVAVPAHVFALTGSVAATGLTLAVQFVPPAVLGPVAGVLVDRWNRRWIMIGADVARAAVVAILFAVRQPADLWLLYVALVAESVGTVVFRPAAQAHTPALVGTASKLSSANAVNAAADGAVRVVGGPLGGVLLVWIGFDLLIGLDVLSYLLSAVGILLTATLAPEAARIRSRIRADVREGLAFLGSQPIARNLLLINTFFLAINACLSALLVPYGMTVLGGSAPTGLVMAALGIGFLLGAPVLRILVDRVSAARLLGGSLTITGFGFAALFLSTSLIAALSAATLIGAAGSITLGGVQTTLQRVTPAGILGRTSSAVFTAEAIATVAGALAGPALAQAVSLTSIALSAGISAALVGVLATALLPNERTPCRRAGPPSTST